MNILWALVFVTQVVGLVLRKPIQARADTNYTQVIDSEEQPVSTLGEFAVKLIGLRPNKYISQAALADSIIWAIHSLCLAPYKQYMDSRDYTPPGRHDLRIKVKELPFSPEHLNVQYTMGALFGCFARLNQYPRANPQVLSSAYCGFGFREPGAAEFPLSGTVNFLPGDGEGSATSSSGSGLSVPDISVTRRIKQRANVGPAALAGVSSTITDPDPFPATLNALGGQESSSVGNLTSRKFITFNLRGDGAIIPPDQLLLSILEATLDRASQPRDGPIYTRTFTPGPGGYIVRTQGVPGVTLTYPTLPGCLLGLLQHVRSQGMNVREGDWICLVNYQDTLLGRLTKKPDGSAGVAAPQPLDSVDVTRRNY